MPRAIFVRADNARCIEDVRDKRYLRTLNLGYLVQVCRFLGKKADEREANHEHARWHSRC